MLIIRIYYYDYSFGENKNKQALIVKLIINVQEIYEYHNINTHM